MSNSATEDFVEILQGLIENHQVSIPVKKPNESEEDYCSSVLESLVLEISPKRAPLTPLQADIFKLTNAVKKDLAELFGMDEDELKEFNRLKDPVAQARKLAAKYNADPQRNEAHLASRLDAGRTVVQQFKLPVPITVEDFVAAIGDQYNVDLSRDDNPGATSPTPKPVNYINMNSGRVSVRFSVAQQSRPTLDQDRRPVYPKSFRTLSAIIDPGSDTVQIRGNSSDSKKVKEALLRSLRRVTGFDPNRFSQVRLVGRDQYRAFVDRMKAQILRSKFENSEGRKDGVQSNELSVHQEVGDLRLSEAYKEFSKSENYEESRWFLSMKIRDESYNFYLNLKEGTVQPTKGDTRDDIINFVFEIIRQVREDFANGSL